MRGFDPRRIRRVPVLWMLLAAAALVGMLVQGHLRGPVDPTRHEYGVNYPGDLTRFLAMGAFELLVLTAILRPWSYHRSPGRALLALVPWTPWALFGLMICMHCGPTGGALALWRLAMVPALLAAAVVSGIGLWRARRTRNPRI
ncbi:hypothetical protein [Longimicrobium sp.]|uniref:hypothetical protein n=1 Tax=Longimicrobium sp. TaxID=2029185 RepID=UPI002E2F6CCD|nr:hypothetical protein [Longimicrobium sp.]HEX6040190.1 hypothetical protein [Longimicrobium sp.]